MPAVLPELTASPLSRALFLWNDELIRLGHQRPLQREDVWAIREDMATQACAAHYAAVAAPQHEGRRWLLRGLYRANCRDFWLSALHRLGQEIAQLLQPLLLARILRFLDDPSIPVWVGLAYCFALLMAACTKTLLENHYFITCVRAGIRARAVCVDLVYRKSLQLTTTALHRQSSGKIVNLMQIDSQKFYDSSWGIHLVWAAIFQVVGCITFLFAILGPAMLIGLGLILMLIPVNGALVKRQHRKRKVASIKTDARVNSINEVLLAIRAVKYSAWEEHFAKRIGGYRWQELRLIRALAVNKAFISTLATATPSMVTLVSLAWYVAVDGQTLDATTVFTSIALFEQMKDPLARLSDRISSFVEVAVASDRIEKFLATTDTVPAAASRGRWRGDGSVTLGTIEVAGGSFSWEQSLEEDATETETETALEIRKQATARSRKGYAQLQQAEQEEDETVGLMSQETQDNSSATVAPRPASPRHWLHLHRATTRADERPAATLRDINLKVSAGGLVFVIGTVGSGKSSLLSAILGEIAPVAQQDAGCASKPTAGAVSVCGDIAYLAQDAWILNMSLRENVLIGATAAAACHGGDDHRDDDGAEQEVVVDEARYREALRVTGLEEDLRALPAGDRTEIGERGINISGGQKQRVSLARMCYSRAPVCLVDDPTSALDAVMAAHVLEHCLGPTGMLARERRTRLIVTNALSPATLCAADKVVWLDEGAVRFDGPFSQLVANNDDADQSSQSDEFAKFLAAAQQKDEAEKQTSAAAVVVAQDSVAARNIRTAVEAKPGGDQNPVGVDGVSAGKLVRLEDRETGVVRKRVYAQLCAAASEGYVSLTLVAFIASQAVSVGRDYFLAFWTAQTEMGTTTDRSTGDLATATAAAPTHAGPELADISPPPAPLPLDQGDGAHDVSSSDSTSAFLGWFFGLTFLFVALTLLRAFLLIFVAIRVGRTLHRQSLGAVLFSPLSFFDTVPTGRILNRFAKDTESVDTKVFDNWRGFLDLLFPMVGTIALVCYITPAFVVVVPVLFSFAFRIQGYYRASSRELKRLASISRSPMYDWFSCTLAGLPEIRASRMSAAFCKENADRSDEANRMQYIQKICDRWLGTRLEMMGNLLCFMAMLLGVLARGSVQSAFLGLSLSSSMRLARTVNYAVRQFTQLESEMTSVERVLHFVGLPTEPYYHGLDQQDRDHPRARSHRKNQRGETDSPPPPPPRGTALPWPPADGSLEFSEVVMRYRPALPAVLRGVSFHVRSGDKLGVAGRTGSGKSSLVQVLFRLVEQSSGQILFGGVDTRRIGVGALRSALSICPQDAIIFSGTVKSNLDPLGEYQDHQITTALQRVGLAATVGLSDAVQEGGGNFSGGMRQMLCLARTLLRKSKILVLDEATSSISPEVDAQIQAVLVQEFEATTLLVIAHRLQTIMDSDEVLVMAAGEVVEHGPPSELLQRQGGWLAAMVSETSATAALATGGGATADNI